MKSLKKFTILFLLFAFSLNQAKGQAYRMELGLQTGKSFYMGDANQSRLFWNNKPAMGILYRYNLNGRFSIKANASVFGISGTTVGNATEYPGGAEVSFDRNILDAGVQFEFNFYEYGMPSFVSGSSPVSPYVFLGVGMTAYKAEKNKFCANIPFGLGVRIKALPRLNVGCEWSFRNTFTDDLDYADYGGSFRLSDPWLAKSASNKNKDWYSALMLSVSYDLYGIGSNCYR